MLLASGQTAVWFGHGEAVTIMLAHGADIDAVTETQPPRSFLPPMEAISQS